MTFFYACLCFLYVALGVFFIRLSKTERLVMSLLENQEVFVEIVKQIRDDPHEEITPDE